MKVYALSKIGLVRKNNEDCYLIDKQVFFNESFKSLNKEFTTFAVFDGLGGRNAGEIASFNSAQFLASYFNKEKLDYQEMLIEINEKLLELANSKAEYYGMGTTIAAITIKDKALHIYNLGDSIIFRIRDNKIYELTEEHSYAKVLLKSGVSLEEANKFRHKMTKCLGMTGLIKEDVSYKKLRNDILKNDLYILTTDGITDLIDRKDLNKIFLENNIENALKVLETQVLEKGARDNYTLIVLEI